MQHTGSERVREREITAAVSLTDARGDLNPAAVGYTRTQLHDTSGVTRRAWGRNKRWEYWSVIGPRFMVSLTVSAVDYAGVQEVWVFDRATGAEHHAAAIMPFARGVELPGSLASGPARVRTRSLQIEVDPLDGGAWRLAVRIAGVSAELRATPPAGSEALGVVVPWSDRRFQYTVKAVAIPTTGTVRIGDEEFPIDAGGPAWGVLDHGRGRWPYDVRWNWAAGSGIVDGRRIGIQLGGQWTVGTGATENALFVDGRLHKISEELEWDFDPANYLAPWHIRGERADLAFTPFHDKVSRTALGIISTRTDQCFGHWSGWMSTDDGERVRVDGAVGFAEDVHNRW